MRSRASIVRCVVPAARTGLLLRFTVFFVVLFIFTFRRLTAVGHTTNDIYYDRRTRADPVYGVRVPRTRRGCHCVRAHKSLSRQSRRRGLESIALASQ